MSIEKKNIENEDLLENYFSGLYAFLAGWKEVEWEYIADDRQEPIFTADHVLIHKVAGFPSAGYLWKYLNTLYGNDFATFTSTLYKKDYKKQIRILENLVGQVTDLKYFIVKDFKFDGRIYKRFNKWCLREVNKIQDRDSLIPDELVLKHVDPYVLAFLDSMEELKGKLLYVKAEIEAKKNVENDPMTFEYVGYVEDPSKLNDLFTKLCEKGFLIDRPDSNVLDFKRIFSGKKLRNPIRWNTDIQDLSYFIKRIKANHFLEQRGEIWIRTCHCFIKKNGKPYEIAELSKCQVPKRADEINSMIMDTLTLGN